MPLKKDGDASFATAPCLPASSAYELLLPSGEDNEVCMALIWNAWCWPKVETGHANSRRPEIE